MILLFSTFLYICTLHHVMLACFLGALQLCASKAGKPHAADDAKVHANVYLGRPEPKEGSNGNGNGLNGGVTNGNGNGGKDGPALGLRVGLCVEGVDDDGIIQAAHAVSILFSPSLFRSGL